MFFDLPVSVLGIYEISQGNDWKSREVQILVPDSIWQADWDIGIELN